MAVKIRNVQNGRVATVTNTLGRALVKMGRHEYVTEDATPEPEPIVPVIEEAVQEKKQYRTRRMKAKD